MHFLLNNFWHFSLSAVFILSNLEQYLLGNNCLVFQKEFIIEDSLPIPLYTQYHLWMKTSLWWGWWWFISLSPWSLPFHIIVQYPPFIVCYFFNGTFLLYLSRELHAEIWSKIFFICFCLTYVETSKQLA